MEQDEVLSKTAKALGIGDVLPQVYKDLLQPSVQQLGENLVVVARTISIALAPLEAAVWGYDQIKAFIGARLTKKLSAVDPSKIQSPPLNIAGPVLLHMHFVAGIPELREMYANLLASSMNADEVDQVHPAFVSVIQQLTPNEARILSYISKQPKPFLIIEVQYPRYDYRKATPNIATQFAKIAEEAGVEGVIGISAYLDNLKRLALLEELSGTESSLQPDEENGPQIYTEEVRQIEVTRFGEQFLNACIE